MYRIPLDDYNSNSDVKFNTCSSTRNCNQPKFNFPTDRASRAMSGRSSNVKNQFDIMCFLMGVELERLNQENEKLKHHNLDIKENAYENKNYEFQLKDLSERLVKKELKCQELENQLTDANKMIAQKEILVQNQYQQINQQLQVIQQLQYTIKQLECKLGFLVCENENLSSKRNEELINIQHVAKSQKDYEELQKVYSSLLDNYNMQNEKLNRIEAQHQELEYNYQQVVDKKQQQEMENKSKMIQYVDCKQKLIFLTVELDRMNEVIQQQKQELDQKQKKFDNKQQILMMRIILHCAEIDRLIDVQSKLMNENKWYRNQVELYAMMIGDNNKVVKLDF
ncbi:unnamed protein product (macronuclear) [Paramecium tetraurelia]|uniref:Uncharacterized protein n=1 Tax=Paramecium tetraurelia TaxID=5888 RepID=A0CDY8_PARTE|nr:uncharacterized protein GSPATT00007217001 [Paramecium tetraurelia]CAK69005.1 unnamed protein product [Paramecium tetraurelia]|eukprot:XP_001436402.1 hypothetical protein (macronuclear) [Paramecium tetraurelia strain d4-2]